MNEKLLWFGRYLGCRIYVWDATSINDGQNIVARSQSETSKLILKELKDISDEGLKYLNQDYYDHSVLYRTKENINTMVETFNYKEIDFLRSKGYAIGIPREYYITEEELNKLK